MTRIFGILLADRSHWDNLADRFHDHPGGVKGDVMLKLLIVATLIVGLWGISRVAAARDRRRSYRGPIRLFVSLCRAHRLTWSDGWLLWRLARSQRLEAPSRLFLEAERFEPDRLDPAMRLHAGRLKAIHDRLFGAAPRKKPAAAERPRWPKPAPTNAAPLFPVVSSPALDVPPWPVEEKTV